MNTTFDRDADLFLTVRRVLLVGDVDGMTTAEAFRKFGVL
jgi:hypothetical protein